MTRQIELSKQGKNRGKYAAIVDDEDFERINQYRWAAAETYSGDVYAVRVENRKTVYMHRDILGSPDNDSIDHVDMNGLNNSRSNLRTATPSQNGANCAPRNVNNFKGVHCIYRKNRKMFRAQITISGKSLYIGTYDSELKAARAYNEAALKYHGEFARLNVIPG